MALYSCVLRALPYSAGGLDFIRAFYTTWFDQAFRATDYALWKAIPLQLSNFVATFTWSYMDMFVTLVSMALTQKYTQLYARLAAARGKVRQQRKVIGRTHQVHGLFRGQGVFYRGGADKSLAL
jgi:hypothetical protein